MIALNSHYKEIFIIYKFNNCCKCFNIIKFFFIYICELFIMVYILKYIKTHLFEFETLFFSNKINFTWKNYNFLYIVSINK